MLVPELWQGNKIPRGVVRRSHSKLYHMYNIILQITVTLNTNPVYKVQINYPQY